MLETLMKKLLNRETITYLIAGVLTTILNIVVFKGCNLIGIQYLISNVIAWVVAVIFAFVVNKTLVFASRSWAGATVFRELWQFVSARLLSGVLETAALVLFVQVLGFDSDAVKIIAGILVILANYALSKWVIFRKKPLG